jgi:DNA (cytosine-5)-methyltransferase 1
MRPLHSVADKNSVDNPFKSPVVLSFCPGILGLERGLARAGVHCRVAAYVEIEAFIIANLVAGMEAGVLDPAPIWTDAKTFDARPFRGRIHGIIGGYPCPGESKIGCREGHEYKGFIWPHIRKAISAAKPLWAFFENVHEHLSGTYPIVQRSLRNMGYRVEAGVYTAEEVGAPHQRTRLFILALANTLCKGLERGCKQSAWKEQSPIRRSGIPLWPAEPGESQHGHEEPRLIKPGVGSTIDGYNFREDLLRALGNSVVEQTAEIAFIDLLRKHLK